jgi:hypothetical protein
MNEIELFKEYFEYKEGNIYWLKTSGTRGIKGTKAGKLRKDGYFDVGLKGKYYLLHRVIFALTNNYLPEVIDHVDHNRANNFVSNLREATYSKNAHNSLKSKNNSTGVKGIRLTKNNKYEARVAINSVTHQVGTFEDISQALQALEILRLSLHGEFTCNG